MKSEKQVEQLLGYLYNSLEVAKEEWGKEDIHVEESPAGDEIAVLNAKINVLEQVLEH